MNPGRSLLSRSPWKHWPVLQTWVWVKMQGWEMDGEEREEEA